MQAITSRSNRPLVKKAPASAAAMRIVQAAVHEDCSLGELSDLAASDPAFAIRVLAMVNSPTFSLATKIQDVKHAVSMLGLRGMRNLALSLVLSDMIPPCEEGRVLLANCIRRATAARAIAVALGRRDADNYFTAGLFLESGLLVWARDDLKGAGQAAGMPASHRMVMERWAGRPPHTQVGAELGETYRLPAATVRAVAQHHDPEPPNGDVESVCWLAERVASVFEGGDSTSLSDGAIAAAEKLGIAPEIVHEILAKIPAAVEDSGRAFDRDVGEQVDLEALLEDAHRSLVDLNGQYEHLVRMLETVLLDKEALADQLRAANEELALQATTDGLTGLANKRAYDRAIDRDLARAERDRTPLSLLVVDVDHFKKFNDTYGHTVGDDVLRVVGATMRSMVRTADFPARYGGEEFVVVLPNTDAEGAHLVGERLRVALENAQIKTDRGALRVTVSIGVATTRGGESATSLFERADGALYDAKQGGRNRVCMARDA